MSVTTLAGIVRQAADRLRTRLTAGQDPVLDAEVLARHVLGWDRATWMAESRQAPPAGFRARLDALVDRRLRLEPIAYLTGTKEFRSLEFEVTPDVLIPRPCTETLVEEAAAMIERLSAGGRAPLVADVGTGSGCVAIALAAACPAARVIATDISRPALDVARRNAARHGVAGRITFMETSLLDGVPGVDLVVSNPPYLGLDERCAVMPDVWGHEPLVALFSGEDGLDALRGLLAEVSARRPVPPLLFEFGGVHQEPAMREAVAGVGLQVVRIANGLAGHPLVVHVEPVVQVEA